MDHIRKQVLYTGHVQGVGFRYNALRCAQTRHVTGFVRNLSDGRVELVIEGEKQEVDDVLDNIRDSMHEQITDETTHLDDPTGEFSHFSIQH